jgi:hypothetical protein
VGVVRKQFDQMAQREKRAIEHESAAAAGAGFAPLISR